MPKWEWNAQNYNSFVNIYNNTAPFLSITLHQKEPLDCAVYSHCPTNDSYNICMHSCCLPCNYVTKLFGILQRVIKSQMMLISPYALNTSKVDIFPLRKFVAKFSHLLLNFQVSWKGNYLKKFRIIPKCCSQEKMTFLLCWYEELSPYFKLYM